MGECYLLTGLPGSGKSYFMMNHLLKKKVQDEYVIFHNIDGLKPEKFKTPKHVIDYRIWDLGEYKNYFNCESQKEITEEIQKKYNKKTLWVFDEAHRLGFENKNDDLKSWIAYHRHYGQQIWILTQGTKMVQKCYRDLAEYEYRAKGSGAFKNPWFFIYTKYSHNGVGCGNIILKLKKEIFQSYKSEEIKGNRGYSYAAIIFLLFLIACGAYFWKPLIEPKKAEAKSEEKKKNDNPRVEKKETIKEQENDEYSLAGMTDKWILLRNMKTQKLVRLEELFPNGFDIVSKGNPFIVFSEGKIHKFFIKIIPNNQRSNTMDPVQSAMNKNSIK